MEKEEILNWWYTPNANINPYIYGKYNNQIEEFHKSELIITRAKDGFAYPSVYPGPICTIYNFNDYGNTWAFTKEELGVK